MKAVRLHAHGGPEDLVYEDAPTPSAGAGEVLVQVHAAGVIPSEFEWSPTQTTAAGAPRPLPFVMGHEFSGVVAARGDGVHDLREGDAVYGMNDWYRDGAEAEYCVARATEVAPKPRALDHVQAAAVPISALTAWQGLLERAQVAAGQRVLVHGAAGAVGGFAVQLAAWRGAHVVGTCAARDADLARELGADQTIDYATTRFEEVVRDVDVVLDTVGDDLLVRSLRVLRPGGIALTIAASAERTEDARLREAFFIVTADAGTLAEITQLIDDGTLRVLVGTVLPLAEARAAYERRGARVPGKTVVRVRA